MFLSAGAKSPKNQIFPVGRVHLLALAVILSISAAFSVARPVWAVSTAQVGVDHSDDLGHMGTFSQGQLVEISFESPVSDGMGQEANPFKLRVDVTFTNALEERFVVPAFFDGDGHGGMKGNLWMVRFRPQSPGIWSLTTSSTETLLDAKNARFDVSPLASVPIPPQAGRASLYLLGTLEYVGGHYLKFSNGGYWIKSGIDDPENFLGHAIGDWTAKKAAIDYLCSKGINSIYIITNNIDGDDNDTWPRNGETAEEAKANSDRFNLEKLQQWEDMFTDIQEHGMVLHLVLNDDSAWNDYDHEIYFREMVARFGHHPGLIWNLGEEANEIYSDAEQNQLAGLLKSLDPYDHPVTVHRMPMWPFFGNPNFDLTSMQTGPGSQDIDDADLSGLNRIVAIHRLQSESSGRPIPIMVDELQRIAHVNDTIQTKVRTRVLYPVYFGGGNFELHFFWCLRTGWERYIR